MYILKVVSSPAFTNVSLNSNADRIHQAVSRIPNLNVEFNNYPTLGSYEAQIFDSQLQLFGMSYNASNSSLQFPIAFIPDVDLLSPLDLLDIENDFKIREIAELEAAFRSLMLDNGLNPDAGTDEPVSNGGAGNNGTGDNEPITPSTDTGGNNGNNQNNGNDSNGGNKKLMFGMAFFLGIVLIKSNS